MRTFDPMAPPRPDRPAHPLRLVGRGERDVPGAWSPDRPGAEPGLSHAAVAALCRDREGWTAARLAGKPEWTERHQLRRNSSVPGSLVMEPMPKSTQIR